MKWNKKLGMMTMALSLSGLLVACGENDTTNNDTNMNDQMEETMDGNDHSGMDMSGSGDVPEGLKSAENPTFFLGDPFMVGHFFAGF